MTNEAGRILVADADQEMCAVISYNLEAARFLVDQVGRGSDAEASIRVQMPDLAILDLMLPVVSGLELCRRLRSRIDTLSLPIIIISDLNQESDRVRVLDQGADDYLSKPFSMAELTARVQALLRRSAFRRPNDRLVIGGLTLDLSERRATRNGRPIHLGPLEYGLLACLMRRPGQVFSRVQLLGIVWPDMLEHDTRTVDVQIGRLRRALSQHGERDPIITARGQGYAFDDEFGPN